MSLLMSSLFHPLSLLMSSTFYPFSGFAGRAAESGTYLWANSWKLQIYSTNCSWRNCMLVSFYISVIHKKFHYFMTICWLKQIFSKTIQYKLVGFKLVTSRKIFWKRSRSWLKLGRSERESLPFEIEQVHNLSLSVGFWWGKSPPMVSICINN